MGKLVINAHLVTPDKAEALVQLCPFGAITYADGALDISSGCKMCKMCVRKGQGLVEFVEEAKEIDKSLWKGICVYADCTDGKIHRVTFELCGKARELAKDDEAIIITADTMVFLDGLRLGKPRTEAEAVEMLRSLSGRTHQVCTGVTVCRGETLDTRCETTGVVFRPLTEAEILSYVRSGEPMDKAGAYGIQGKAALFVSGIDGDYFNVMGLPLHLLGQMLSGFGVELFE